MPAQNLVTLELRTARDAKHTPEAAVQLFAALPNPPQGLLKNWTPAPTCVFEIFNQGQVTYFFLTIPEDLVTYMKSQLTANYPEILITQLEHNPLEEFDPDLPQVAGELKLTAADYFPLKTYSEFTDVDPLAGTLSALTKSMEGDTVLIQFNLRKNRETWKHHASTLVEKGIKKGQDNFVVHPQKAEIESKITQPSLQVGLNILVQSQQQLQANQLLTTVAQSFQSVDSQHNRLTLRKPLFRKQAFVQHILHRTAKIPQQYLSLTEVATLYHLPNEKLSTVKNIAWGKNLLGEPPENLPFHEVIPEDQKDNVNLFAKTEFKNQQRIFGIWEQDLRRHMYVIGKSGTGKTTLLANMIINDLKHDKGLAVVDPHGDLIETILHYIPKRRINDVILIDPTDPHAVVKLNLFEGGSVVHRELVASGIVAIFQKLYAHSWGPRLEYILRNTLLTLLSQNAKLEDILRMLTDKKYRRRVIDNMDDLVLKNFWIEEFEKMHDRQRTEAISPILNKVGQFVTSPLIRNVVNTNKSSFNIEEAMNSGQIILVNLSQGKLGEDNTALLGAMLITKIQLAAMSRVYMPEEERRDFHLYIDEFQNFATISFIKILSEARKYRLSLILANQYIAQIPDEIKAAIFGNVGSMASFILGAQDAEWMMKEFGNKYTQEDLVSLGRYQIITKLMIDNHMSHPFPAETLSLASSANQNKEKVIRVSRERYARKK